jgi:hypothetical protein
MVAAKVRHELAKANAVGMLADETLAQYEERIAGFEQQLAEADEALAAARVDSADLTGEASVAKQDADEARSQL